MKLACLATLLPFTHSFMLPKNEPSSTTNLNLNRRNFVSSSTAAIVGLLVSSAPANAGIDPSLLQNLKVEGDDSGSSQRLRQIESIQKPASDLVDIPFEQLASGVSYREYREGKGEAGTFISSLLFE